MFCTFFISIFKSILRNPIILIATYSESEVYYDGSLVAVCFTSANTFWSAFYFITSITIFFALPVAILSLLYVAIAYKLLRRNSTLQRPTSPPIPQNHSLNKRTRQFRRRYKLQGHQACTESFTGSRNISTCNTGGMHKHRKQVIFMLVAVVSSFFVCLLPFRALTIWIIISSGEDLAVLGIEGYYILLYFCRIMLYLNSALNPILYNLMSSKFRTGFWRLAISCCRGNKNGRIRHGLRSTTAAAAAAIGRTELSIPNQNDRDKDIVGIGALRKDHNYAANSISISSSTDRTSWRSSMSTSNGSKMISTTNDKNSHIIGAAIVNMTNKAVAASCPHARQY